MLGQDLHMIEPYRGECIDDINRLEPTSSDDLITKHYISLNTFYLFIVS